MICFFQKKRAICSANVCATLKTSRQPTWSCLLIKTLDVIYGILLICLQDCPVAGDIIKEDVVCSGRNCNLLATCRQCVNSLADRL